MGFNGYLIKLGGEYGDVLPLKYMRYETYQCSPNQRMDFMSTRDSNGVLHRTVVSHTATKIEFNIPRMDNDNIESFMRLIRSHFTNAQARTLTLYYYDMENNDYKTGTFYMPDINFTISNIDEWTHKINYAETRVAFIEY